TLCSRHLQIFFSLLLVRRATLRALIIARREMRRSSAGFLQHLRLGQWEKFRVPIWSPRKCVDPIKSEDVVDAENVEDSFYAAHSPSPPGEISRAQKIVLASLVTVPPARRVLFAGRDVPASIHPRFRSPGLFP